MTITRKITLEFVADLPQDEEDEKELLIFLRLVAELQLPEWGLENVRQATTKSEEI